MSFFFSVLGAFILLTCHIEGDFEQLSSFRWIEVLKSRNEMKPCHQTDMELIKRFTSLNTNEIRGEFRPFCNIDYVSAILLH